MLHLAFALFGLFATPFASAEPVRPAPYVAAYAVSYRGIDAGLLQFELRPEEPDRFVYESRPEPNLLARLLVSDMAVERSVLCIDAEGVRPLSWFRDDGKPGNEDDGELEFAWGEGWVRGSMEGENVDLPVESGLQDRLSFQVAVMTALLRGRDPGAMPMIDDGRIKHYNYRRAGTARIVTPAGEFDTVLFESTRPGSSRLSRVWHSPALGYLPVRFENLRKGAIETVMELVRVQRGEDRPVPLRPR